MLVRAILTIKNFKVMLTMMYNDGCGCCHEPDPVLMSDSLNVVNTGIQTVATGGLLNFATNRISTGNAIRHTPGTANFTICEYGLYLVSFNAGISLPTGTDVAPVTVALDHDGAIIEGTEMTVNPTEINQEHNITFTTIVSVPRGMVSILNVVNESTDAAVFINPSLSMIKIA